MKKVIKELKFEDLTLDQKLGMVLIGGGGDDSLNEKNFENCLALIRKRALGAIWIGPNHQDLIDRVKEVADYPILVFTDAENGMPGHFIGRHVALGYADDDRLAYLFGKVTGVIAKKMGYTNVCNPLLDMTTTNVPCGGTVRSLGGDKERVSTLAAAIAEGMHDAGIMTVGKHYPSVKDKVDTHMAEGKSMLTEEELLDYNLYPYLQLMKKGLLDGIMTGHSKLPKIDDEYPASLSAKVTDVLRRQGFDGLMLTDALSMMGVVAKFGESGCRGLAIKGGNDLALVWKPIAPSYESMKEAYEKGVITPERLDEAVRRVLEAQHRSMEEPRCAEITPEEWEEYNTINSRSIAAITDPGLSTSIDPEGRHFFVILTEGDVRLEESKITVDTFSNKWYNPAAIAGRIKERFPHSGVMTINQFPSSGNNYDVLETNVHYDDVVFITFCESQAYIGRETYTTRFLSLIEALQITNRVTALVHFGNPFLLEELPHVPRILNGCLSFDCTMDAIDMLSGIGTPSGNIPYRIILK